MSDDKPQQTAYNSPRLQYIMKLIDLKMNAAEMKEQFLRMLDIDEDAAIGMFNDLVDDLVFITVGAPGLRYWQQGTNVWASTREEIQLNAHRFSQDIIEIDVEEFQQLRRSEWAQLSTPNEEIQNGKTETPD